jgi:hypothetical protein
MRRRDERARAALVTAIAAALTTAAGEARGADRLEMDVVGACPDEAAVRRLLDELLSPEEARQAWVIVQDKGPHYRIFVRGVATTLDDPARDCAARARQAAVIATTALRSQPQVFGPPIWTLEKGVVFDVASSGGSAVWAPGAEFRGAYGSKTWSLYGAAGARGPATLTFANDWKAELLRFPLDGGARVTRHGSRLRPWILLAGSLTFTGLLGQNLVETERQWRLDLGALLMAGATLPITRRIGVGAALSVRWQPRPYQLQVAQVGTVGETPAWWFGLSLDYTIDGPASSP